MSFVKLEIEWGISEIVFFLAQILCTSGILWFFYESIGGVVFFVSTVALVLCMAAGMEAAYSFLDTDA